jgi:hypothetical protein
MRGLDVNSPRGQVSLRDEQIGAQLFIDRWPMYTYLQTDKSMHADVDAILTQDSQMKQVIETKCRYDCDIDKFFGAYGGQWLVTHDKIVRAMAVAKALQLGLTGFVYLVQSKTLLVQPLVDAGGRFLTSLKIETTQTQANINGGLAIRTNAFIDMRKAQVYT